MAFIHQVVSLFKKKKKKKKKKKIRLTTILIQVKPKLVRFDCYGGVHLDLCSNTVSLDPILYSLGLKDYSLTELSREHVNNLVGLHSACSL